MKKLILVAALMCATPTQAAALAVDKQEHIILGAAVYGTLRAFGASPEKALAAAVVVGAGKEVYDHQHPSNHKAEIWDAVATAAGAATLFVIEKKF